ncbi:hypothetical protein M9Y10_044063 [Tritrichomonas musculus]|uniref:Uncharacterized protein n=1 Tax=Tritrichomonas musculus TaxID=1915356 RepID=A0ABR2K1E3_9EUKA
MLPLAYKDEKKTIATVVKGLTPTKFINVYENATSLSKLTDLGIKKLISAIKYDGSNAMLLASDNVNDVKAKEMANNNLKLDTVATVFV